MKTTMRKTAACLLVLLLVFQMIPAFAQTIVISGIQGPIQYYREKLEITSEVSIIPVGSSIQLTATTGYDKLRWESKNEAVATVSSTGLVTAVSAGMVKILAKEDEYSDSIVLQVIDKTGSNQNGGSGTGAMTIIINANKEKITYDGQEHVSGFKAVSNDDGFDAANVKLVNTDRQVSAVNCGTYPVRYEASDFIYEGNDQVTFVISDGWMQIKPATVTVRIKGNFEKLWGQEDPDYSEYLVFDGLIGDDKLDVEVTREAGEEEDFYKLNFNLGEGSNSNYRVIFPNGVLVITMPEVKVRSSLEGLKSVPAGTEVTLTAEMENLDTDHYLIQWQWGDSADPSQMKDIEGANGITYTYIFNEETAKKFFRVVISLK